MRFRDRTLALFACAALAACGKDAEKKPAPTAAHEEHKAPHGGEILELGEEDAHLEMVHDGAAGTLTVYVLDKDVKTPIAIAAPTVTVRTKDGNKEVPATAVNAGADGNADTWKMTHDALKSDPLDGRIRVTIRGKPYQVPLEPEGHAHK
jgi:hypothetical protein